MSSEQRAITKLPVDIQGIELEICVFLSDSVDQDEENDETAITAFGESSKSMEVVSNRD
mgnify:CR=1 FL=1